MWIKNWKYEVYGTNNPIILFCDNQSTILLSQHDAIHQRSKHIAIRYHFLRDHIIKNNIIVKWISTKYQLADVLTKPMITKQFTFLINKLLLSKL